MTPIVEKQCLAHLSQRLRDSEAVDVTVVVPAEVVEHVHTHARCGDDLELLLTAESISHLVHPGPLRVMYSVIDDIAAFGAYVDRELHALLETDAPELREWATEQIDAYRAEAVPAGAYGE